MSIITGVFLANGDLKEGGVYYSAPETWPFNPKVYRFYELACPNRKGPFVCLYLEDEMVTVAKITGRKYPPYTLELPPEHRVGGHVDSYWQQSDSHVSLNSVFRMPRSVFCAVSDSRRGKIEDWQAVTPEALGLIRREVDEMTHCLTLEVRGRADWIPPDGWLHDGMSIDHMVPDLPHTLGQVARLIPAAPPKLATAVRPPPVEVVEAVEIPEAPAAPEAKPAVKDPNACPTCQGSLAQTDSQHLFHEVGGHRTVVGAVRTLVCLACGDILQESVVDPQFREVQAPASKVVA